MPDHVPDSGEPAAAGPAVGVLSLQGDVVEHFRALEAAWMEGVVAMARAGASDPGCRPVKRDFPCRPGRNRRPLLLHSCLPGVRPGASGRFAR